MVNRRRAFHISVPFGLKLDFMQPQGSWSAVVPPLAPRPQIFALRTCSTCQQPLQVTQRAFTYAEMQPRLTRTSVTFYHPQFHSNQSEHESVGAIISFSSLSSLISLFFLALWLLPGQYLHCFFCPLSLALNKIFFYFPPVL